LFIFVSDKSEFFVSVVVACFCILDPSNPSKKSWKDRVLNTLANGINAFNEKAEALEKSFNTPKFVSSYSLSLFLFLLSFSFSFSCSLSLSLSFFFFLSLFLFLSLSLSLSFSLSLSLFLSLSL
jgi:hypothetical protein